MSTIAPPHDQQAQAFDASQYDVRPEKDGFRADDSKLIVGGAIDIDPMSVEKIEFLKSLRLGQEIRLVVYARVTSSGWRHGLKGEDAEDHVVHQVGLKAHSLELPGEGDALSSGNSRKNSCNE